MVKLSDTAVAQIKKLQVEQGAVGIPLRVFIAKGGCSGFEYGMEFGPKIEGDTSFNANDVELIIDPNSLEHLKGVEIDFDDGLHGKGFEIKNPNAANTCGCGKSFN